MRTTKTYSRIVSCFKRLTIRIAFLFLTHGLCAQIAETFSDGNFISDPNWIGDTADFKVIATSALPNEMAPSLRLLSENSDTSFLALQTLFYQNLEWRFLVKLSFNTSANNFARVYLVSDNPDLTEPLNGIYLQLGGAKDSLMLVKQEEMQHSIMLTGTSAFTGNSSNLFRIKVTRDVSGTWKLYSDPLAGCAFLLEGQAIEPALAAGNYFGFFCRYTSSNASKFYFDDVYIQDLYSDTTAPVIDSVEVMSDHSLVVYFSEAVDFVSAKDTNNYVIGCGIGNPFSAYWEQNKPDQVILNWALSLPENLVCNLELFNIRDLSGNLLVQELFPVVYTPPDLAGPYDLVINEIMADVSPSPVGLPTADYIEIFNRTIRGYSLGGYAVKPRESANWIEFDDIKISAGGYLVLTNTSDSGSFSNAVSVVGLEGFSLNNEGTLKLRNRKGIVIHQVDYSKSWYSDEEKKNGGWSLEQIDPFRPCPDYDNWAESVSQSGGTPGFLNSIDADNPVPLEVKYLIAENDSLLKLVFNQVVSDSFATIPTFYEVDRNVGLPDSVVAVDSSGRNFYLLFHPPFFPGVLYELKIKSGIIGCIGNVHKAPSPVVFGIPEVPEKNDLVINELLFNPVGNGVDFLEVYNRSQKIVDPSCLQIGNIKTDQFGISDTNYCEVSPINSFVLPGDYVVLTKDPDIVQEQYDCGDPQYFITMSSFPILPNEEGVVVCATKSGNVIDLMEYSASMHYPLLTSQDGVSLERIHFDRATSDWSNWHSAASSAGFATPALINSQFSIVHSNEDEVYIDPEVFSPDNDGIHDVTRLCYGFEEPGYMARLLIYDFAGRPVRCLANNELLSAKGCFIWDGTSETGARSAIGIYVFLLEVFNTKGVVKKYKRPVVVAGRLR